MRRLTALFACLIMWSVGINIYGQQKLFSKQVRMEANKPMNQVMDFLENYFVGLKNVKGTTVTDKMADDKVHFRKGSLSDYYNLCERVPFSINLVDKHYEVSWYKEDAPYITVVFPAQCDLIMGKSQKEIQNEFRSAIVSANHSDFRLTINPKYLEMYDDTIWISKREHYELESLNDASYFIRCNGDTSFSPLFDNLHKSLSAANLFQGMIDKVDRKMYVEQSVYGMTSVKYTIKLSQWLDYCKEQNLKVYFAVEEERKDGLMVMVIAQSSELCYNHLLSIILADDFIGNPNSVIKVKLTPYIPTHNIKNLFQKESRKSRKKIW